MDAMALADLAANLPAQAVSWRHMDVRASWDDLTYLVAKAADCLDFIAWAKTAAAQKKGAKWHSTIPYPGKHAARKRRLKPGHTTADLDRRLALPRKPIT